MIEIIILLIKIIFLLYFTGLGLTVLTAPKNLKNDFIWIAPWMGTILIALLGITLSLAKIPMQFGSIFILGISAILIIVSFRKKKFTFLFTKEHLFIFSLIVFGLIFNLFVLFQKSGFPTTISLLNTDPISYSYAADFLVKHTLYEGNVYEPFKNYLDSVGTLIHSGYRWGSPLILSFFNSILKVKSYEIYTILITLYFVLTFPLVYILAKLLNGKKNYLLLLIIFFTYCLNSTLLYILYNAFFAQMIFDGLFVWIAIIIFSRILNREADKSLFSPFNFLLAISLASIATIYPDGFLFTILPFIVWVLLQLFIKKSYSTFIFAAQAGLLILIISPIPVLLAIKQNFSLLLSSFSNIPPSWENIRYATPLDMTGFYNLYYYKKLPDIVYFLFSLPIIFICLVGFLKAKGKYFLIANLFIFISFCLSFIFIKNDFFLYLRTITYTLFIFSILFSTGFIKIFSLFKNQLIKIIIIFFMAFLTLRSADRTLKRSYWHSKAVDKSIVSLRDLNNNQQISEPFFMSEVYLGEGDLWQKLWQEYMLSDKKIITLANYQQSQEFFPKIKNETLKQVPHDILVLSEKNNNKIIYTKIIWQNKYYILGEIKPMKLTDSLLKK